LQSFVCSWTIQAAKLSDELDVSHYPDATAIPIALCNEPQSVKELMEKTKEKNRGRIKDNVLQHLCESGLVEPTIKNVPNSPKQKYALTDEGREKLQTTS
jgi:DNA-binding PadR family transcriptional regulator